MFFGLQDVLSQLYTYINEIAQLSSRTYPQGLAISVYTWDGPLSCFLYLSLDTMSVDVSAHCKLRTGLGNSCVWFVALLHVNATKCCRLIAHLNAYGNER